MNLNILANTFCAGFIGHERPLGWVLAFLPVFIASLAGGLWATWICKKLATKLNITDKPDATVKTHTEPVAYLGGIGMLVGVIFGILTGMYLLIGEDVFNLQFKWLAGILVGAVITCTVGVVDDLVDIKPWQKLAGQFTAALILVGVGILPDLSWTFEAVEKVTGIPLSMPPLLNTILGIPVVIIFVLGATNSLNLLDGLDGLCGGVTAIITFGMLILAIHLSSWNFSRTGDAVRIIICMALCGAVLGFLPFNRHPAKIFMGDAGSLLLGFCVAALMIMFAESNPRWWFASVMLFGLPILDTATALVRRKLNGRPLMVSDRGHIYDQLMDRGLGLKKSVQISYAIALTYAVIGLLMSQIRTRYAIIVYIIVFIVSGFIVWKKGFLKMDGLRGAAKK
ncbi:putative undecaprenyl-phosphate N-acetylglucosaminyl 1-phosphate transferase [Limihaloglobus sulfuriphilus]|uniref:Putative undecaprenyl-phosphate N-acetylglucosaminyl 1-phosphate transferase n=1 Tax=Limihaloglobus sulfuriphilus TaxID=1851148 RepID=A0A1R7T600_9BACT|nr:MraY family glycosyltransferase [Limihaloglobus sulfuriphilus]AQQ72066.1 putative undecaprenyl-phosphate N-acetylglucosaminyl 1-phosphate transferase [Limihaloglobus sulfuriphilus]